MCNFLKNSVQNKVQSVLCGKQDEISGVLWLFKQKEFYFFFIFLWSAELFFPRGGNLLFTKRTFVWLKLNTPTTAGSMNPPFNVFLK